MKVFARLFVVFLIVIGTQNAKAQYLPPAYEPILNEIAENFKEIRGTTSLEYSKNSLRILGEEKIILKMKHKGSIKTLNFVKQKDEEGQKFWVSDNKLTTDMVNKYEADLTEVLNKMLELSREKMQE